MSSQVACCLSASPFDIPLNKSDVITPELPLAPLSMAPAALDDTSATDAESGTLSRSVMAFERVRDIFVPVSPSGTG